MELIKQSAQYAGFPEDAVIFFDGIAEKFTGANALLEDTCKKYFGENTDEEIEEALAKISEKTGVHRYTADMFFLLYCVPTLREKYKAAGIDESICRDTVSDLTAKLIECKNTYNVYGTFVFGWFRWFFQLKRFKLGRLEFEKIIAPYDYKDLKQGEWAYACHIPSGGKLSPESVDESFKFAKEFYGEEKFVVMCDSWMLYPPHYEVFPENSNLRKFYDKFDVFLYHESEDNHDFWRIFNRDNITDVEEISKIVPENTLQKRFIEYFKSGRKMGNGIGIAVY